MHTIIWYMSLLEMKIFLKLEKTGLKCFKTLQNWIGHSRWFNKNIFLPFCLSHHTILHILMVPLSPLVINRHLLANIYRPLPLSDDIISERPLIYNNQGLLQYLNNLKCKFLTASCKAKGIQKIFKSLYSEGDKPNIRGCVLRSKILDISIQVRQINWNQSELY